MTVHPASADVTMWAPDLHIAVLIGQELGLLLTYGPRTVKIIVDPERVGQSVVALLALAETAGDLAELLDSVEAQAATAVEVVTSWLGSRP